jgi:hypothetical protein
MVTFDTTFLTLMFIPDAPHDIPDAKARVDFLLSDLHGRGEKVIIPAPALAEILIKSGKAKERIIKELAKSSKFMLAPFDHLAAFELALMSDAAFTTKDKRAGATETWVKVKYDRQIVAITKVNAGTAIYSDDSHMRALGEREGLKVVAVSDIKIPKPLEQPPSSGKLF